MFLLPNLQVCCQYPFVPGRCESYTTPTELMVFRVQVQKTWLYFYRGELIAFLHMESNYCRIRDPGQDVVLQIIAKGISYDPEDCVDWMTFEREAQQLFMGNSGNNQARTCSKEILSTLPRRLVRRRKETVCDR